MFQGYLLDMQAKLDFGFLLQKIGFFALNLSHVVIDTPYCIFTEMVFYIVCDQLMPLIFFTAEKHFYLGGAFLLTIIPKAITY